MKNVSGKIYLCFAREDSAKVKQIITELEQEEKGHLRLYHILLEGTIQRAPRSVTH